MKEVNPAGGTIAVVNALVSSGKPIVIHVSPATSIRRYSPDSVNFDEAKPGTLDQIKPGDQLRARGTKNGWQRIHRASDCFRDIQEYSGNSDFDRCGKPQRHTHGSDHETSGDAEDQRGFANA